MKSKILTKGFIVRVIVIVLIMGGVYLYTVNREQRKILEGSEIMISNDVSEKEHPEEDTQDSEIDLTAEEDEENEISPEVLKKAEGVNSFKECKEAGFEITKDTPPECWAGEKGFYEVKNEN